MYCTGPTVDCNNCESIRPPCECYPNGNITDQLPIQWPDQYEQEGRDYMLLNSQMISQLLCLKIDGTYCQNSINRNNTDIEPFSCNNTCHRNLFKTIYTKYWLRFGDPSELPFLHKYGWTNETYNTCPLDKVVTNCPYTSLNQFNIHV